MELPKIDLKYLKEAFKEPINFWGMAGFAVAAAYVLYVRSSNCEAGHAPKINWLLEGLFQILQIDLRQFHSNTDLLSLRFRPCRSDYRWLFHPRQEEPVDSQRRPPALTIPCRACMPGVYRPTACPELRAQFPA